MIARMYIKRILSRISKNVYISLSSCIDWNCFISWFFLFIQPNDFLHNKIPRLISTSRGFVPLLFKFKDCTHVFNLLTTFKLHIQEIMLISLISHGGKYWKSAKWYIKFLLFGALDYNSPASNYYHLVWLIKSLFKPAINCIIILNKDIDILKTSKFS